MEATMTNDITARLALLAEDTSAHAVVREILEEAISTINTQRSVIEGKDGAIKELTRQLNKYRKAQATSGPPKGKTDV